MSISILAVCAGNICRSPMAVAAIRSEADRIGLSVTVDSAGTGAWNLGDPPSPPAVEAAEREGLVLDGRARQVHSGDFSRFDVIVTMDRANLRDLEAMAPSLEARAKLRLFRTYDQLSEDDEIPDPFGGADEDYDRAISQIKASAAGLVATLAGVSAGVEDPVALE